MVLLIMLISELKHIKCKSVKVINASGNSRAELKKNQIDFKELQNDITNNLKYMIDNNWQVNLQLSINNKAFIYSDKGDFNG